MDVQALVARPSYIDATRVGTDYGFKKTFLYELLNKGEVRARKLGRKTLIEVASLDEYMNRQPAYEKAA